jgi:hypothetical protein
MKKKIETVKIINRISSIRAKNNKNWMDLLKLAFKHDPKNASKILGRITNFDKKISKLTQKLHKISR